MNKKIILIISLILLLGNINVVFGESPLINRINDLADYQGTHGENIKDIVFYKNENLIKKQSIENNLIREFSYNKKDLPKDGNRDFLTLACTDDAYIDTDYPYENYGDDISLDVTTWVDIESYMLTYIKFDLSSISLDSTINSADLKLYCYYYGLYYYPYVSVYPCLDNSWDEMTITAINAPIPESTEIDTEYILYEDMWYSWDVTSYVQDNLGGYITIVVFCNTDWGWASFWSKEYIGSEHPKLGIDFDPVANSPPTADFSWIASGLNVDFTDLSLDNDGYISSWLWDFGDGNTSTLQNPSHSYADDGTYSVTLTVTDDDGATDSETKSVTVTEGLISLNSTDDSDADVRYPNNNYGSETKLELENDGGLIRVSYVKFDISSIPTDSTINSASFKVYVYSRFLLEYVSLGTVGNNWDEDTLTWNNKPGLSTNIGVISMPTSNQWYSWDVNICGKCSLRWCNFIEYDTRSISKWLY